MNKRKVLFIAILLLSVTTLSGCSHTKDSQQNVTDPTKCFSTNKTLKKHDHIWAVLQTNEAINAGGIIERSPDPISYTLDELSNISFGFQTESITDDYYITSEICENTTETPTYVAETNLEYLVLYKKDEDGYGGHYGSFTKLSYELPDGTKIARITNPGNYSLNIFSSTGQNDWELIDTIEFEVKE